MQQSQSTNRSTTSGGTEPSADLYAGTVVRAYGKFFTVQLRDEPRQLLCTVRGSLKRTRQRSDVVAVGDIVSVVDAGADEGQIMTVAPRQRVLARQARHTGGAEQIILANPDQVLILFAAHEPEPHRRLLDRFLVLTEAKGLPAMVGINKIDLERTEAEATSATRRQFADYERHYPVRYLSVKTGEGLDELRQELLGKVTAVTGPSGAGKSSLLNALRPELDRKVGAVSHVTGKGRHTTVGTELLRVAPDTFVADTPGVRALALHDVAPEALDHHFPEFRPYLDGCFYADCTHLHEPGCAIREAVATNAIAVARYDSYAALRRGDPD